MDHLDGFAIVLGESGNIVRGCGLPKVGGCQERLGLGVQPKLVFHVHGGNLLDGRAGDADVGVPPGGEILVLDVSAAKIRCGAVNHEYLAVVPVSPGRGHEAVYQPYGLVEAVEKGSCIRKFPEGLHVLGRNCGFVHHHPYVQPSHGLVLKDVQDYGSGRVCAYAVVVHVDGRICRIEVLEHELQFVCAVRDEPHGVSSAGRDAGILFHERGKLLILRLYAFIGSGNFRDIGCMQGPTVTAARNYGCRSHDCDYMPDFYHSGIFNLQIYTFLAKCCSSRPGKMDAGRIIGPKRAFRPGWRDGGSSQEFSSA